MSRYLLGLLTLQELPVRRDLLLQPGLDIHEHLVFVVLALQISSELSQLRLNAANHGLDLRQLCAVAPFRVCQAALQCAFLPAQLEGRVAGLLAGGECGCILGVCVYAVQMFTYHAELGLQLYLQALQGASQVGDLRLAALQLLSIDGHLTVQLFSLKMGKCHMRHVGPLSRGHTAFRLVLCKLQSRFVSFVDLKSSIYLV